MSLLPTDRQIKSFLKRNKRAMANIGGIMFLVVVLIIITAVAHHHSSSSNGGSSGISTAGTFSSSTGSATTSSSTTTASSQTTPSCTTYQSLSSQTWLEIVKDPASYKNQCFTIYGDVTQFDSNTGNNAFLADVGGVQQTPEYGYVNYPTNTWLTGNASTLRNVVENDLFTADVLVVGPYTYKTQIGSQTTVPELQVNSITVTGTTGGSSQSSASN